MITLKTSTGQYVTSHITILAPEEGAAHRFYSLMMAERVAREALTLHPEIDHIEAWSQPSWEPAPRRVSTIRRVEPAP